MARRGHQLFLLRVVKNMSLPKRNPLIIGLYGAGLIGMFGFIAFISPPDSTYIQLVSASYATGNEPSATQQQISRQSSFSVAGITSSLALDKDPTKQLNDLWQSLATMDLASELNAATPLEIYAVYHHFNASKNSVEVTIGFQVTASTALPAGRSMITVDSGKYLERLNTDVLSLWEQPRNNVTLTYKTDFERYRLDQTFNVKQQTAFVGVE